MALGLWSRGGNSVLHGSSEWSRGGMCVLLASSLCTAGVQNSGQVCTAGVEVLVQNGAQRTVSRACTIGLEGCFLIVSFYSLINNFPLESYFPIVILETKHIPKFGVAKTVQDF